MCQDTMIHKAFVKLIFYHDHPIDSAHVLGFRPVLEETRREYVRLFSLGHSASSAHHHFEEDILHEGGQTSIADQLLWILNSVWMKVIHSYALE